MTAMEVAAGRYGEEAENAAERWRKAPSPELREQIVATWRMCKWHRRESEFRILTGQLKAIWREAFKDAAGWDFDFDADGNGR